VFETDSKLERIEESAFSRSGLTSIQIPSSVVILGRFSFSTETRLNLLCAREIRDWNESRNQPFLGVDWSQFRFHHQLLFWEDSVFRLKLAWICYMRVRFEIGTHWWVNLF
jgi:hypothetical protein